MSTTLEAANDAMRAAVRSRLDATPKDDPKMVGYKPPILAGCKPAEECAADLLSRASSCCEGQRMRGDGLLSETYAEWETTATQELPAERLLLDALAVIRDRRPKYGGPLQHFRRTVGMINAAFADVLKRPLTEADWAIFMTLDKVARYCGPNKTSDGPVDLAGYAACLAEVEAAK
jgi:hypothetical protein